MKVRTKQIVVIVFILCVGALIAAAGLLSRKPERELLVAFSVDNTLQVDQHKVTFLVPKINAMSLIKVVADNLDIRLQHETEDKLMFQIERLPAGYSGQFSLLVSFNKQVNSVNFHQKKDFENSNDNRLTDLISTLAAETEFQIFEGLRCDSQGKCLFPELEVYLKIPSGDRQSSSSRDGVTFVRTRYVGPTSIQEPSLYPTVISGVLSMKLQDANLLMEAGE